MPAGSTILKGSMFAAIHAPRANKTYIATEQSAVITVGGEEYRYPIPISTTRTYNNDVLANTLRFIPPWNGNNYHYGGFQEAQVVVLGTPTKAKVKGLHVKSLTPAHFEYKGES